MTFSPDVEQILNAEVERRTPLHARYDSASVLFLRAQIEIIEEAVRLWAAKQERDRRDAVAREIAMKRPTSTLTTSNA